MQQTTACATGTWALVKDSAQVLSYLAAAVAAIGAFLTYGGNSRHERAKWAVNLYEKFFESKQYEKMRENFDCKANSPEVQTIVKKEPTAFTDYLNFFEMVCFLVREKELRDTEVLAIFQYYLGCLVRHEGVAHYISTRGFENLDSFLKEQKLLSKVKA